MTIDRKTTHAEEAAANLISFFRGKPTMESILQSYVAQVQELEDCLSDLLSERWIENAVGAQVDGFGSIVGEAREGRSDADYKIAIKARMRLNLGNGTAEDIVALIRGVVGDVHVRVNDYYPAGFIAEITDPIDPAVIPPDRILSIVQAAKPGGVYAIVSFGVAGSFRFDAGPGYDIGKYGGALA